MAKTAIVIQARMGSTRLPNKVLIPLSGTPMLAWVTRRLKQCTRADSLLVATSTAESDNAIEAFCKDHGCSCFRGAEDDVLSRFLGAAHWIGAETVVRVTADCPLISPEIADRAISFFSDSGLDYTGCVHVRSFPRGLDVEIIRIAALERADREGRERRHREHVTPYIYENPDKFSIDAFRADGEWFREDLRFCVDSEQDLEVMEEIIKGVGLKEVEDLSVLDIIRYVNTRSDLLEKMHTAEHRHHEKDMSDGIRHEVPKRRLS